MKTFIYFILLNTVFTYAENLRNESSTIAPINNKISPWFNFIPIGLLIVFFCCTIGCRCCSIN